jgi:Flp pilus assembly protein TadD
MIKSGAQSRDQLIDEAHRLHRAGQLAAAETGYRRALLEQGLDHARAHRLLGSLLLQRGELAAAAQQLEKSVEQAPNAAAYTNLGMVYRALGRPSDAVLSSRKAIELNPSAEAFLNLGHAFRDLNDLESAASAYANYLRLKPADGTAHAIMGDTQRLLGRPDAAMHSYESALTYDPTHLNAHINIAGIMMEKGWYHAAAVVFQVAQSIAPEDPEVQKRLGAALLHIGQLAEGWEWIDKKRFECTTELVLPRPVPPPYWQGEDLSGKSIVVWTDQGVGDEILHGSIFADVIQRAKRCVIECSRRLVPIFARSFPGIDVRGYEASNIPAAPREVFDYQIPASSLGRYLRTDFAKFPAHRGYLKADPAKVLKLRQRYEAQARGRRIVGVAWKSTNEAIGDAKSARLKSFGPILEVPGVMFVNLQYGDCTKELVAVESELGVDVYQDPEIDPLANLDDFFAQIAAMDLVVSSSNSTVHAAGSLNVPTWVLLPLGKGLLWYWFLRREDSPWYPSVRLIRAGKVDLSQPWEIEPVARAAARLKQWLAAVAPSKPRDGLP